MDKSLMKKIFQLDRAEKFECWYLVKHPVNFTSLCYLVKFLKSYIDYGFSTNLNEYIKREIDSYNKASSEFKITSDYRALRVGQFLGLFSNNKTGYSNSKISDVYYEINEKCKGRFEKEELYQDIIERQIEKMFTASVIDEERGTVRKSFRLFPIIFLYKILIEIGKRKGDYFVTNDEYKYFIATTSNFNYWEETVSQIIAFRKEPETLKFFKKYNGKIDNRFRKAIELLRTTLNVTKKGIRVKKEFINYIIERVRHYEKHNYDMSDDEYINFLCSNQSMMDVVKESDSTGNIKTNVLEDISEQVNKILVHVDSSEASSKIKTIVKNRKKDVINYVKKHPDAIRNFRFRTISKTINKNQRVRNDWVAEVAKLNANYIDEVTGEKSFQTPQCENYVEAHHIIFFNECEGPDFPENIICLNPENHALIHHGSRDEILKFYEKCKTKNLFNITRFEKLIKNYQALNFKHIKFLVEQKIISVENGNNLEKLIKIYGDKNSRPTQQIKQS